MNNTIAIFGSSRRNGNTGQLIDQIAKQLNIEVVDLAFKNISPFDYDHNNINDDFVPLMDHVLSHKNIIFVSPVYWYAMSAQMKVFIDRLSDFLSIESLKDKGRELKGKTGFVVTTSASSEISDAFIDSFTQIFDYLGIINGGYIHINCQNDFNPIDSSREIASFVKLLAAN